MIQGQYPGRQPTVLSICKTVQSKLSDMQDSWMRKKAEEIQSFADGKDMEKRLKTV